jgi:hypothetical protein
MMSELLCCCEHCNDGEGDCIYPWYGCAPHSHDLDKTGSFIGSTVLDDKSAWPENFIEDMEAGGLGTYAYCLECGRPNNEKLFYQDQDTLDKRKKIKAV